MKASLSQHFQDIEWSALLPLIFIIGLIITFCLFFGLFFNFETRFFGDTPFADPNYYVFHPEDEDTCKILSYKYSLHHPMSNNPIKGQVIDKMFEKGCSIPKPDEIPQGFGDWLSKSLNNGVEG